MTHSIVGTYIVEVAGCEGGTQDKLQLKAVGLGGGREGASGVEHWDPIVEEVLGTVSGKGVPVHCSAKEGSNELHQVAQVQSWASGPTEVEGVERKPYCGPFAETVHGPIV